MGLAKQSTQINPKYAESYFNIGLILSLRGENRESLENFEKSAEFGYERGVQYAADMRQKLGREHS